MASRKDKYPMTDVEVALDLVLTHTVPFDPVLLPLSECLGHILAEDVQAKVRGNNRAVLLRYGH